MRKITKKAVLNEIAAVAFSDYSKFVKISSDGEGNQVIVLTDTAKLSDTLRKIDAWAFAGCENLCEIIFPDTLVSIGNNAFNHCINLENIEIPENVEKLSAGAFSDCEKLKKVSLPCKFHSEKESILFQSPNAQVV